MNAWVWWWQQYAQGAIDAYAERAGPGLLWCRRQESNPRQADYRSAVLPLNYTGMVRREGVEPSTRGIEARCSIQLSYRR